VGALYALLVGIDAYRAPVSPLRGCRNDIEDVHAFLRTRCAGEMRLSVRQLLDGQATRAAVIDGFRTHLAQAGPDDAALFWYSGHGSHARVPQSLWHLEPSGELQTLVCVDSRHGVPDLLDKELSGLIGEVTRGKAHTVVVLDACHSGGANRKGFRVRTAPPAPLPAGLLARIAVPVPVPPERPDHVALAACRTYELALEAPLGGRQHGVFSWALLRAMSRLGPAATYRELLTAARCEVEGIAPTQAPQLHPVTGDLADRAFLGQIYRSATARSPAMLLRYVRGWEVDAGSCHGIPSTVDGEVRVAMRGSAPVREAVVTRVHTTRSDVEPVGWRPDKERQYPMVLSGLPLPPMAVAVPDGPDGARIRAALDRAGPTGGPSPHVRIGEPPAYQVVFPEPGRIRILDGEDNPVHEADAARAVDALEHLARWRLVKAVTNDWSGLAGAVTVEIVTGEPGDDRIPLYRKALDPNSDGVVELAYRRTPSGWAPPQVFVRLRNRSGRRLYCVLLDLTDRYRSHAQLFPGADIGPGISTSALDGRAVAFRLPPDRPVRPGAFVRDWLKLLVAEEQFSAAPFELPALGQPPGAARTPVALRGILDRIGQAVIHRDAGLPDPPAATDWTTTMLPVLTRVPGGD
jgi:hypothetical protein